jgi:quercetin dioxygenase-like cupin family protein
MNSQDFISSGIIEVYCLGIASDEEKALVEKLASENKEVKDEIVAVNEALSLYASAVGKSPAEGTRSKIMNAIAEAETSPRALQLPPRMTLQTSASEWVKYISDNHISEPSPGDEIQMLDLPASGKQVTYIAWAKKGVVVEESHPQEDEFLLMISGECTIAINGAVKKYKAGDIVFIPKNSIHRAEVISEESMIVVGQRIAA